MHSREAVQHLSRPHDLDIVDTRLEVSSDFWGSSQLPTVLTQGLVDQAPEAT